MGTTLTGTTPQDTYDSLIKVTDNGPISGTAKYLSDGLGNDSVLALSTSLVGIGTSSPDNGLVTILKNTTSAAENTYAIAIESSLTSAFTELLLGADDALGAGIIQTAAKGTSFSTKKLLLNPNGGNVGIGTSAPAVPLDVTGNIRSSTGILFGADTAAANLLDDYEEGTWTMGVAFGGASVGVTADFNSGTYTKIGRQVTVNGYLQLSSKGSSTGLAFLTGLPFTAANTNGNFAAASLWFVNITFANQFQGRNNKNTTTIELEETTEAGVAGNLTDADFANNSGIMISVTYQV